MKNYTLDVDTLARIQAENQAKRDAIAAENAMAE